MAPARSFVADDGPSRTRSSALDTSSTAEYHQSLRDQGRQSEAERHVGDQQVAAKAPKPTATTRRWIMPTRPKTSDSSTRAPKSFKRNAGTKDTIINPPLQLSRQEVEEFETLPIAVRRKYFSTLERLRFAQTSGALVDSSRPSDYHHSPRSFTFSNDKAPQRNHNPARDTLEPPSLTSRPQTSVYQTYPASADHLPLDSSQRHLTRQEQVALARSLRESVILDAADEAIYKIGRRSSRHHPKPPTHIQAIPSKRPSMETAQGRMPTVNVNVNGKAQDRKGLDEFYDSFRWLDGDEDLDLSLQLDDYHANLKDNLPLPSKEHRPSFRRHLSISKIPFGRNSTTISRPETNGGAPTPTSPTQPSPAHPLYTRRKSRTLSLINGRHASQAPASPIDPAAAHYQDPEARAKLRVYLASPQKFDEAVEFGFPSRDKLPTAAQPSPAPQIPRGQLRHVPSQDSSKFKTFFSDDCSSVYSDDVSLPEPESPRTPQSPAKATLHPGGYDDAEKAQHGRVSDGYAQLPAASREMTLRMTLTRSDLRACEDQIYGWQKSVQQATKSSQPCPPPEDLPPRKPYVEDNSKPKESLEAFFASLDGEDETPADGSVVKRFWHKVRRN